MNTQFSWLQLSDLHIYKSTDWNIMRNAYQKLAKVINPNFLVVTGDFRHKKKNPEYKNALVFLNEIVRIFGLKKSDVFLVPGNHDVDEYPFREEIITTINSKIETNVDAYCQYMNGDSGDLRKGFERYHAFVRDFYGKTVNDDRVNKPSDVFNIVYKNYVNIVVLNTALISNGKEDEKQIVDIDALSKLETKDGLPTIVLAHHDLESLQASHQKRIKSLLNSINARVYLCGDEHQIRKGSILKSDIPNTTFPSIVCGKSAVEVGDSYSDLCVIEYSCKEDGKAYVQVYEYEDDGFLQSPKFYYDVNKQYNFPMTEFIKPVKTTKKKNAGKKNNSTEKATMSIWLPDAELAKGKQTRFNSFTTTDSIEKFFDSESGYLGIVSVKGIGKTFLLQVKRVKSGRKFYCLPDCDKPSVKNNWATERVSFDRYSSLKTDNIHDDLVLLWKTAIKCYVINNLKTEENIKTVNEYVTSGKITSDVASLCIEEHNESLESVFGNILIIDEWSKEIAKYQQAISNLCKLILRRRKKENPSSKDIAIFIDKVDQAIKQTNAEPPADCVVCNKGNTYAECQSSRKGPEYCSEESGCQSKNCCYGCEIFASSESNNGLRIYENSNASKRVHVNIWQYLQLALMSAAGQISDEFNGEINVFYTIRQEAFHCEGNRLGEQNQKVAGKIIKLSYSIEDQKKIFMECIHEQSPKFLFAPECQLKAGLEEYAFVGIKGLCHPYCKDVHGNNIRESLFMCIYRHSFDRSRDIQRYGEELTKRIEKIRACSDEHSREETVKQIIEDLAAILAYCSRKSESTVNPSYYTEKMRYLPNYWADNDNFEHLLSLIDRNLLFEDDVKKICRKINGCSTCPVSGCRGGECKRHPFSMLFNMGYLGYIVENPNNTNSEIQQFLDASEISYFIEDDDLMTDDRVAYIIHPALTKTIEKKFNKGFMHFSGFVLGKGLRVETEIMAAMIEDRKTLDRDAFLRKYYYKP